MKKKYFVNVSFFLNRKVDWIDFAQMYCSTTFSGNFSSPYRSKYAEAYSERCQRSKMEFFAKIVDG